MAAASRQRRPAAAGVNGSPTLGAANTLQPPGVITLPCRDLAGWQIGESGGSPGGRGGAAIEGGELVLREGDSFHVTLRRSLTIPLNPTRLTFSYLAALDPTQRHYIGAQSEIGDVVFAHGGSGFALSRPALEAAVALYVENKADLEAFTASHWAGDCVLGKALFDSGTNLTWAWPMWQGRDIGNMNYSHCVV